MQDSCKIQPLGLHARRARCMRIVHPLEELRALRERWSRKEIGFSYGSLNFHGDWRDRIGANADYYVRRLSARELLGKWISPFLFRHESCVCRYVRARFLSCIYLTLVARQSTAINLFSKFTEQARHNDITITHIHTRAYIIVI